MAVETILKSWLSQKYADNNTLKTNYSVGTSLTAPSESNPTASASHINNLLTSLQAMKTNVYLRYSPKWGTEQTLVTAGNPISRTKKDEIDALVNDLLAMNARYSKTQTEYTNRTGNITSYTQNSSNNTGFSQNDSNASRFTQFGNLQFTFNSANRVGNDRTNPVYSRDTKQGSFTQDSRATGFTFNASRWSSFSQNSTNCAQNSANNARNSNRTGVLRFTGNDSRVASNGRFTFNASRGVFTQNSTNASGFANRSSNLVFGSYFASELSSCGKTTSFFSQCEDKTATVNRFFRYDTNASAFNRFDTNISFTRFDSNSPVCTQDTRFTQRFRYDFTVKSDGTTTTNSNVS